jgi:class 3 adenylate cyclase
MAKSKARETLNDLLNERNQYPERAATIDALIQKKFAKNVAVLAMDMCGFTKLTTKRGIIFFLALIREMEAAARPAIEENRGWVLKQEADNLFAVFDQPTDALEAAMDILRAFEAINAVTPEDRNIRGSIGIGYGEMLVIGKHELFGTEMNLACKLGEDLGGPMEILLTSTAYDVVKSGAYEFQKSEHELSGNKIVSYRFIKRTGPAPTV